ncbi:MAG: hypothetical protein H0X67_07330 [Acidobacteria bacterium]|nr:hypothetical protein [Acidobacteriota bacterium]
MIWFFERHDARLHYEIRHQPDGPGYELVITHPDGRQEVERYSDAGVLPERSASLHETLSAEGWHPPGPRPGQRASA